MQKLYALNFDFSRPGFLSGLGKPRVRALNNSTETKADYYTFVIPPSPIANSEYFILQDNAGRRAAFTTDASPTQLELGLGLLNAVRGSALYDVATPSLSGNILTLTSRSSIDPLVLTGWIAGTPGATLVSGTIAGTIVSTAFNTGATNVRIPFGTFVARRATDKDDEARIPTQAGDKVIGVAMSTYATERIGIGPGATVGYYPNEVMDVLDRCNDIDGIWVQAVESDLSITDALYVSYTGATAGLLTKSATGANALANASLVKGSVVNSDGSVMALLSINFS